MPIRAVFFDVAHTLLYKPAVLPAIHEVMRSHGLDVPFEEFCARHAIVMDATDFPDRTDRSFYRGFNAAVLRSLGCVPTADMLEAIFEASAYQPWVPYDDVAAIAAFPLPRGVLSNWDLTLKEKLGSLLGVDFEWILGSAEAGTRKPQEEFFRLALEATRLKAAEIAYVGDSMKLDIEPATAMGFRAILLDRQSLYPHASVPRIVSLTELGALV